MQARALATRARILDQAAIAFARDGYDAASLTGDILEPAGVSVGSFYHQFDNKLDVLFALLNERLEGFGREFDEAFAAAAPKTLHDRLSMMLTWVLDHTDALPDLCLIQLRERWNPDPNVRSAVVDSWAPWRRGIRLAIESEFDDEQAVGAAARMLGRALLPTLGDYLSIPEADRPAWRKRELPHVLAFCGTGVAHLATR